jgi:hypothetical protein
MPGESEEDSTWAVEQFKHLVFYDLMEPEEFITDNDKASRKVLSQGVTRTLYSWHIQQNVLRRIKKTWHLAD